MKEKDINLNSNQPESEEKTPPKKSAAKELLEWVQAIVIAVVLAVVIRNFVFTVVRVDGQSMEPTYQHSDRLIVWRLGYEPKNGDIVVFNPPGKSDYWIKRIIATEGQHVEINYDENAVYIDGEKLDEPYLGEPMYEKVFIKTDGTPMETEFDIPEDCVFVLGDNRNNSSDSRAIGYFSKDHVIGKVKLRFWPFNKIETY